MYASVERIRVGDMRLRVLLLASKQGALLGRGNSAANETRAYCREPEPILGSGKSSTRDPSRSSPPISSWGSLCSYPEQQCGYIRPP
jgi:hypothetical protein